MIDGQCDVQVALPNTGYLVLRILLVPGFKIELEIYSFLKRST